MMQDHVRLPLRIDAEALATEAFDLPEESWTPHFNSAIYEGDWSGVALRSVNGEPGQLYPDPTVSGDYADTATLGRCPNTADALRQLDCPLLAVRFLALGPGAHIREHDDYRLGLDDGEIRLHIPLVTGPGVEFTLSGRAVEMAAGECWYLNLNLPHEAANRSPQPRIHLVVDCVVNHWLRRLIESSSSRQEKGE